ncbi:multidrug resistance-associated protein 1 [Ixodes scapularis]
MCTATLDHVQRHSSKPQLQLFRAAVGHVEELRNPAEITAITDESSPPQQDSTSPAQLDIDPKLPDPKRRQLINLLAEYRDCFATSSKVRQTAVAKHRIVTEDDARPVHRSPYRVSAKEREVGWQTYYEYVKRVGWNFFLPALLAAILGSGFEYGSSLWLTAWSQNPDPSRRLGYMLGYGGLLTTTSGLSYIAWLSFVLGSLRAAFSFHSSLLESVVHSSISLFDTTPVGRLVNRFSRDIDLIDRDVPFFAVMTMNCLVAMLILAVVVCLPSAYFGLMMLLVTILFLGLMWLSLPSFRQMRRLQSVSRSPVLSHFGETVSGVDTIRAFGATKPFMDTLERRLDDYINCNVHFAALEGCRTVAVQVLTLLLSIGSTLVAVLGRDTLDVGMVGMTLTYTLQMSGGMSMLLTMAVMLEVSLVAVERVMEYFNLPQEQAPWNSGEAQSPIGWPSRGDITFTNYSAAYRDDMKPVIQGVSLKISDCQKIGILGRTGTGKSSLALALFRLIESKSGSITVDGIDIAQIGLHDLRSKMSIIPQDPVVFAGTLRWNLDPFGKHTDAALWEALERAHLKRFLAGQNLNLDCNMTESGNNLSAGQKQLVCLARALLRRSKILVLDEAASSVDLETGHLVAETIRTEFRGTTVVTIAHTVHTVLDCDRILLMNAGKVAEQGTPRELLRRKDGLFSRMALGS